MGKGKKATKAGKSKAQQPERNYEENNHAASEDEDEDKRKDEAEKADLAGSLVMVDGPIPLSVNLSL
ncbi:hypothetical protein FRB95_005755, partial [Tulasnella sp. JGI-2019a]